MFQEHLHVIGMVVLSTIAWLISLIGGRSIRITEKLKFALDDIECDWRRTVREVAEMAGISKYTTQHNLTSASRVSYVNSLNSIECLKLLLNLFFT